jgi:hypothetical protein
MQWSDVEKAFTRAVAHSFSRKRALLVFPALLLCGVITVFCRALSFAASDWVAMSLAFLPILLSSGVLLALGVLLVRIHMHEVKHLQWSFSRLLAGSVDLLIGTSYLSIPPVLVYMCLWIVLGLFFLLRSIPGIGDFFGVIFSFGPFLLILSSLLLCFLNLGLLFFVTPVAALQPLRRSAFAKRVATLFEGKLLTSLALFLVALLPTAAIAGLLSLSAVLTGLSLGSEHSVAVTMQWFFIMIPFCALLTPAVSFFFNFSAETYQLLKS